jgi:hypothetical protein
MAFSKSPSQDTYQTKDFKLLNTLSNRDTAETKDIICENGFYEITKSKLTSENEHYFVKRDGTSLYYTLASSAARGVYFWETQDKLLVAYDTSLVVLTASTAVLETTLVIPNTGSGAVGFTEFLYDTGDVSVIMSDGFYVMEITSSNVLNTGVDPDQPTAFDPHIVFMDGYIFLAKTDTGDIYNSDLNSPLTFTSGDVISAEMEPDTLRRLSKMSNYVLALGTKSIEYFYDAGNASGSPLSRSETPIKSVGYYTGLQKHENRLFFIGRTETTTDLYILEDMKIKSVDNPTVKRILNTYSTITTSIVSNGGHDFFLITAGGLTHAYDLVTELWTRWSFGANASFNCQFATLVQIGETKRTLFNIVGDTKLYKMNPAVYQDNSVNFNFINVSHNESFGTMREKFMSSLMVDCDRTTSTDTATITWSDDDYQTFSPARTVVLNAYMPILTQLGKFRKRAIKFVYAGNYPLRLYKYSVDFNIGIR